MVGPVNIKKEAVGEPDGKITARLDAIPVMHRTPSCKGITPYERTNIAKFLQRKYSLKQNSLDNIENFLLSIFRCTS